MKTCTAHYISSNYGSGVSPPGGSCDNGLGFASVETGHPVYGGPNIIGYVSEGTSIGTRYKVMPGGPPVTVTCTPAASTGSMNGAANADVTYTSDVFPVYIFRNWKRPIAHNNKALPGQSNVFTVECGGLPQSNHQWSASIDKFTSWVVS